MCGSHLILCFVNSRFKLCKWEDGACVISILILCFVKLKSRFCKWADEAHVIIISSIYIFFYAFLSKFHSFSPGHIDKRLCNYFTSTSKSITQPTTGVLVASTNTTEVKYDSIHWEGTSTDMHTNQNKYIFGKKNNEKHNFHLPSWSLDGWLARYTSLNKRRTSCWKVKWFRSQPLL